MAEPGDLEHLPQATAVPPKRGRISVIWIIPILAAVVAIGIAVQRYLSEGPTIIIVFTAAEGLEAGKTFIKYKDVNIGQVKAIRLTNNYAKVEVTAKIEKHAAGLMVEDAKFWIVRPQISLSGVSGLSTLLSGNYIGFEPGTSERTTNIFIGLDVAPVISGQPGREFVLNSNDLGSLSIGSPVYYRRLPVGEVAGYDLVPDGKSVQIKIFVKAPYDRFVVSSTRFWNASGVDVSLGADGVNVHTESLVALLVGGIAFDSPTFMAQGPAAEPDTAFTLYNDRTTAMKAPDPLAKHYVLHFNESLRGLSLGAPVTFLGLTAGEVTTVGLAFDPKTGDVRPEVVVVLYPERVMAHASTKAEAQDAAVVLRDEQKRRALIRHLVEDRGLRAQLKSGSLITGQLYVSLDYHRGAPKVKIDLSQETPEMPVVPSALADLQDKLGSIITKIDRMPLEAIGNDIRKDLESLDQTLASAKQLITNADDKLVPGLKTDVEDLHRTLIAVEKAMNNANTSYLESNAAAQEELRDTLKEFTRAARSLRVLMDELERQPSSVIRGKPNTTSGGR
ncbi:MAG TPA: MlaD family protein [Casimicrobiaceae bacterium]|nr:MlaD family protein [Casimicrobiaceae bacterium]